VIAELSCLRYVYGSLPVVPHKALVQLRTRTRTVDRAYALALAPYVRVRGLPPLKLETPAAVERVEGRTVRRADVRVPEYWTELPIPADRRWVAAARLLVSRGAVVIGEVRVFPAEPHAERRQGEWSAAVLGVRALCPPGGVVARLLRAVPLGAFTRAAVEFERLLRERFGDEAFLPRGRFGALGLESPRQGPRRRHRAADTVVLGVARAYADAIERKSRRALEEAAAACHLAYRHARDLVGVARARGYLTATKQGRGGGELTPTARKRLAGASGSTTTGREMRPPAARAWTRTKPPKRRTRR
jgi:hypothetical protein